MLLPGARSDLRLRIAYTKGSTIARRIPICHCSDQGGQCRGTEHRSPAEICQRVLCRPRYFRSAPFSLLCSCYSSSPPQYHGVVEVCSRRCRVSPSGDRVCPSASAVSTVTTPVLGDPYPRNANRWAPYDISNSAYHICRCRISHAASLLIV